MDKEKAEKAMREAEEKFQSNDIEGAKRMVLRAQKLFPSLPGLPQTLAAFNVHIAAASKDARGHTNWYAVLEVDPSDDIKTIKKQYKKLSLLTHPDKNRSSAAEGAFKLVVQAWETLSSKASSSEKGSTRPSEKKEKDPTGSSSRPSSAQSEPKTTWSSSARWDPKTTWSSSTRWDPKTTSSSTRWDPKTTWSSSTRWDTKTTWSSSTRSSSRWDRKTTWSSTWSSSTRSSSTRWDRKTTWSSTWSSSTRSSSGSSSTRWDRKTTWSSTWSSSTRPKSSSSKAEVACPK